MIKIKNLKYELSASYLSENAQSQVEDVFKFIFSEIEKDVMRKRRLNAQKISPVENIS